MSNFTQKQIDDVWEKGREIEGKDKDVYRLDAAGAIMKKDNRQANTQYGWEIDHIFPKKRLKDAGIPEDKWDDLVNLRPLQADNNRKKGDDYPHYTSEKRMNKDTFKNVTEEQSCDVHKSVRASIRKHYGLSEDVEGAQTK